MRSASLREQSGVNRMMPVALRLVIIGAARTRGSVNWQKMAIRFPLFEVETFENGGTVTVKLQLERKAADSLHQRGLLEIGGAQERLTIYVKNDRICPHNCHFPRILGAVVVLLQIKHDEAVIFARLLFAHGFAAHAKPRA